MTPSVLIDYIETPEAHIFRGKPRPGGVWPEYPVADQKELIDRSTKGSPPFSKAEIARGYRKVG